MADLRLASRRVAQQLIEHSRDFCGGLIRTCEPDAVICCGIEHKQAAKRTSPNTSHGGRFSDAFNLVSLRGMSW